jgi:hypothetical protein
MRQVKVPCQAMAIRYVHDVAVGEFINIGMALLCPAKEFGGARFLDRWGRVTAAFPDADTVHLRRISAAVQDGLATWRARHQGTLAFEKVDDLPNLLGSIIPVDDASIQFSPLISGVSEDPEVTLAELFDRYVGRFAEKPARASRDDDSVWRTFTRRFSDERVLLHLQPYKLKVEHYEHQFEHAWKNGRWNAAQPLSLDLMEPASIKDKAAGWLGRMSALRPWERDVGVTLLVGLPARTKPKAVRLAAQDGMAILTEGLDQKVGLLAEEDSAKLASLIANDVEHARDAGE